MFTIMKFVLVIVLGFCGLGFFLYSLYPGFHSRAPLRRLGLRSVGVVLVIMGIGVWGLAGMPSGSSASADASTEASRGNPVEASSQTLSSSDGVSEGESGEINAADSRVAIRSCDEYATMKDELAIFDGAREQLQGKQLEDTPEAAKARRGLAASVQSYSASAECRDFADQVQGIAGGQIVTAILPRFSDQQTVDAKALFNASSKLYGDAYASYCGSTPDCVPKS